MTVVNDSLPKGWVRTALGEITEINPRLAQELPGGLEVSFLPMRCVEEMSGKMDISLTRPYGEVRKGFTNFQDGDVIFAKITPCMENGKVAVVNKLKNGIGFGSTEFHVIRPLVQMPSSLFFFFLIQESVRRDAQRHMTGTAGQLRVPVRYLSEVFFPLPPLPEQHRIVARIEELFTRLDAGVDALNKIKLQLKRYRQSVLKSAFEGKLTAEWREAHKGVLELASVLLEKIKAERAKTGKSKNLPPLDTSDLPGLPEGWVYLTLDYLVSSDHDSIKRGPFGSAIKKSYFVSSGYKVYEQGNVIYNDFARGDYFISEDKFSEMKGFAIRPGDILMSCSGTVGKIAIVPEGIQPGIINQALLKISLNNSIVATPYFVYLLRSQIDEVLLKNTRGSAMVNISSVKDLRQLPLAISPLAEQQRIVEKIERHLSVADEIEKVMEQSFIQSERLRQSILKRAFEGKLVPQNPNDEPAEKLVERIKEEKAKRAQSPRVRVK